MRYYYIIVEGVHDAALVSKVLRLLGLRRVATMSQVPAAFHPMIPMRYPFHQDHLDNEIPIPYFYTGQDDRAVVLRIAGGVYELFNTMDDDFYALRQEDLIKMRGIAIFTDADAQTAPETVERLYANCLKQSQRKYEEIGETFCFDPKLLQGRGSVFGVPMQARVFVFPDEDHEGVMEDLLLEGGRTVYPDLVNAARQYVTQAEHINGEMFPAHRKKAIVGCVGNILHPGKANQITISRDQWISRQTVRRCPSIQKLFNFCQSFLADGTESQG